MTSNERLTNAPQGYFSRVDTNKPCIGVIKENIDPDRMGRLKVWIRGSTAPETDPKSYIWVNYSSPFAGATPVNLIGGTPSSFEETQTSYGFWGIPPDVGNEVIILFMEGDIRQGYFIGGIFHKNMNQMVPGISQGAAYQSTDPEFRDISSLNIPVAEYNKRSLNKDLRPFYRPLAEGLLKQGLISDDFRGAGSSSARRETPSKVMGWLTPGGNQLILDDGLNSELIRLRTKSGSQILISETIGSIYLITKDGNSWVEIGDDGYIDVYAAKDVSIRSEGNINLRADKNINMEAGGNINVKALGTEGYKLHCPNGNINEVAKNKYLKLDSTLNVISQNAYFNISDGFNVTAQNMYLTVSSDLNLKASSKINIQSSSDTSLTAGGKIIQNAVQVISNTSSGTLPSSASSATSATTPITQQKLDLDTQIDNSGNVVITDVNLETINPRVPHHEPWPDHAIAVVGYRESVEEGNSDASLGSVSSNPEKPLPLVGTPRKGMSPGVYTPKGYVNGKPDYEFIGATSELKPTNELQLSEIGVDFIADHEGFSNVAYPDAGKLSIGFGHQIKPGESFPNGVSEEVGLQLLQQDSQASANVVRRSVTVPLTQSQFDALTSFAYNVGPGAFQGSTLVKELNAGNYQSVPTELSKWIHSQSKVIPALVSRRRDEGLLFSTLASPD